MMGLMDAARAQSGGEDLGKTEARFEQVTSRIDDADFQLPTLLMSVAGWSLRVGCLSGPVGGGGERAGHLTKEEVASLYEETTERWLRFNDEERELADAIREDAFYGIPAHIPAEYPGTDY